MYFNFPTTSTSEASAYSNLLNVINSMQFQEMTEVILQSIHITVAICRHSTILVFSKLIQGCNHLQIALCLPTSAPIICFKVINFPFQILMLYIPE